MFVRINTSQRISYCWRDAIQQQYAVLQYQCNTIILVLALVRSSVRADTVQFCFAFCGFLQRIVRSPLLRFVSSSAAWGIDAEMLGLLSGLHRNLDDAVRRAVLCVDDAKCGMQCLLWHMRRW